MLQKKHSMVIALPELRSLAHCLLLQGVGTLTFRYLNHNRSISVCFASITSFFFAVSSKRVFWRLVCSSRSPLSFIGIRPNSSFKFFHVELAIELAGALRSLQELSQLGQEIEPTCLDLRIMWTHRHAKTHTIYVFFTVWVRLLGSFFVLICLIKVFIFQCLILLFLICICRFFCVSVFQVRPGQPGRAGPRSGGKSPVGRSVAGQAVGCQSVGRGWPGVHAHFFIYTYIYIWCRVPEACGGF